jgi:hypothetical protein
MCRPEGGNRIENIIVPEIFLEMVAARVLQNSLPEPFFRYGCMSSALASHRSSSTSSCSATSASVAMPSLDVTNVLKVGLASHRKTGGFEPTDAELELITGHDRGRLLSDVVNYL